jgi:uncharacterized protein YciI
MALFVITCVDRPGGLVRRMATREAHFAYARSLPGVVRLGGPFLSETGEMIGSLMIIEAPDLAAAMRFNADDPYTRAGLFERVDVRPWRVTFGAMA